MFRPRAYVIVLVQDLNTLSRNNELIKFVDDSALLVPENSDVSGNRILLYTGLGQ